MKNEEMRDRPATASSYLDYKTEQKRRYYGDDASPEEQEAAFRTWSESGEATRRIDELVVALRKIEEAVSNRRKNQSGSWMYRLRKIFRLQDGGEQSEAESDELVSEIHLGIARLSQVKEYLAFLKDGRRGDRT